MNMLCKMASILGIGLSLIIAAGSAAAQEFPSKLVNLVIPYPPGGSAEAQARIIAQKLGELWNQTVVIINKPGAGTTIGAAFVAKSPPDGYTIYLASTSHTFSASLYKNVPYDPVKSFAPISRVATSPIVIVAHPSAGVSTLKELVDRAKAKPNTYAYASTSTGASPHLAMEMFVAAVGIQLVHVPYKGQGPAVVAILGAQTPFSVLDSTTLPLIQSGKLKALAVTSPARWAQLPNVPTIAEFGVPGYECINWSSILAPAGTPREIVNRINATVANALKSPDVRQRLNSQGFEPSPSTPEELEAFLAAEVKKYAKVIADAGIKLD